MQPKLFRSYFPKSLYGRAAIILLLPVVTIQIVVSVVFIQRLYEDVTEQMTANVLLEVATIVARADAAASASAALAAARDFAEPVAIFATLPAPLPGGDRLSFFDLAGRTVIATLRDGLPGLEGVDLASDGRRVFLRIATANGPLGLEFSRRRVSAANPHQLLVLMLFTSILMTVIAYLFLRNQLRPVKRMAQAAEAFGRGQTVPFRPTGATEVRQAGAAFLEMRSRLERYIEQRTLMLSGVSHDIRTPLTRMRLSLSLLAPGPERDALERDVADMEAMVEAFLDFARTESGDEVRPTNPIGLAQRVVERARRGGLDVSIGLLSEATSDVHLRPTAIERALENLIVNGVRYGSHAELSLALTPRTLRFRVEDDGPGIPPSDRAEALKPFTRLDDARNQDAGSGVGLGLAIAADVARQHGGTLTLGTSDRLGGLAVDLIIAR